MFMKIMLDYSSHNYLKTTARECHSVTQKNTSTLNFECDIWSILIDGGPTVGYLKSSTIKSWSGDYQEQIRLGTVDYSTSVVTSQLAKDPPDILNDAGFKTNATF